jgi:hypothetical protein
MMMEGQGNPPAGKGLGENLGTAIAQMSRKPSPPNRLGAKAMADPMCGKNGEDPR